MKPEKTSVKLLGMTRSKAKMYEYNVPQEDQALVAISPEELLKLFPLSIGLLGEFAARTYSGDIKEDYLNELQNNLLFSAHFLDSYFNSKLNQELDPYFIILSSAAYYLCDLPGSSLVLAKKISEECPDLEGEGLEDLLLWLLQGDWSTYFYESTGLYGKYIDLISQSLAEFFENGNKDDVLLKNTDILREVVYESGTPRQLLFTDLICAVAKKRFKNSTWHSLPEYSGLSKEQWQPILQKESFIRELWPSQHLLGKHQVFKGKSAVVQMPTSAGKTKAAEIIIRSAFLSNRTDLAVIVAPFRALCHDIKDDLTTAFQGEEINIDELSDVFQKDFDPSELLIYRQIVIVTPEKLLYLIRQEPEFAKKIGLIIYDEGHQFDSGSRGITYELLLTSIKLAIPKGTQTMLISAVMSNAAEINNWLNENDSEVVIGSNITPTYRSIAFASWIDRLGQIAFINPENLDEEEFFVPRIISRQKLQLRRGERRERIFPEKADSTIALYLGLKLVINGGIAIFCGRKTSVSSLCTKIIDAYERGLSLEKPVSFSDSDEITKLHRLYIENIGADSSVSKAAEMGILTHHNNIPQGIRLSVEYAMKTSKAKFVICTSTLAQGVNLPLRYLIVASTQQGKDSISVRDFHNLIGRAGRAGKYTEGSIIFANNAIYDARKASEGEWRWQETKKLLDAQYSEPCASTLFSIFEPINNGKTGRFHRYINTQPLDFANYYINGQIIQFIDAIESSVGYERDVVEYQVQQKSNILSSIESFILSQFESPEMNVANEGVSELAKGTLAYSLGNEKQKQQIIDLFNLLAENINNRIQEPTRKKVFGKTLYGLNASVEIENWVKENVENLLECNNLIELIDLTWPIVHKMIKNNYFKNCDNPDAMKNLVIDWIKGEPYYQLLENIKSNGAKLKAKSQIKDFTIDHIVDICDNGLAFDGSLLIGAITEITKATYADIPDALIDKLNLLQKRLRYGLLNPIAIIAYELGFSDRIISQKLNPIINSTYISKKEVIKALKQNEVDIRNILLDYPSYFIEKLNNIVEN